MMVTDSNPFHWKRKNLCLATGFVKCVPWIFLCRRNALLPMLPLRARPLCELLYFALSALPSHFLCADIFIDFYKLTVSNIQHSPRTRCITHRSPKSIAEAKENLLHFMDFDECYLWVLHRSKTMRLCMRISAARAAGAAATTPFNITNVLWVYRRRCRHFVSLYDLPFGVRKSIKIRRIRCKAQKKRNKYSLNEVGPTVVAAGRCHK